MRISIVGPATPIPPVGWGAVESLIWDYKVTLEKLGHTVQIINISNPKEIIHRLNDFQPDFCHIQYDDWIVLYPYIQYPCACTTHFAYLEQPNKMNEYITCYANIALLSEVENTTPLVIKEGLICGLGIVCSETVAAELDTSKPWIDVIPEKEINNVDTVLGYLERNREVAKHHRKEIREYGINEFGLENILAYEYIPKLESLL